MKKLFMLLFCIGSATSYGQQHPSEPTSTRAVPTRTVSRSALQKRNSASATSNSAPATPISGSPNDRPHVSFSSLAAHASTSEPSSPRPPMTAPTPLNALIREQDRVALAGERQAAAFERMAAALERIASQNERMLAHGESSGKTLKAMSKSVEALVVAHAALHDDAANLDDIGMKSLLYLSEQREKIINSRSSSTH